MKQLVIDVWEADVLLEEKVLMDNGVKVAIVRFNDMLGGHHMDKNFLAQVQQCEAAGMLWAPYFVYNPWVDGPTNYNWFKEHLPADYTGRIFLDVEVKYAGYSTATYADQVGNFLFLCKVQYPATIYTGEWFLPNLKYWPKGFDYWWAQYPFSLYPAQSKVTTWDEVRKITDGLSGPANESACPGLVKLWQVTGDRLILPGSAGEKVDVSIFNGSEEDLAAWISGQPVTPPVTPPVPSPDSIVVTVGEVTDFDNVPIPQKLIVKVGIKFGSYVQTNVIGIDQTPVPVDPPIPPVVVPNPENLYHVTIEAWQKMRGMDKPPSGGPYTQPCTRATNASGMPKPGDNINLLDSSWQAYVRKFNIDKAWEKIIAADYGPSQGFNGNGKLKYLGLAYPHPENTVKVLEQRVGTDGQTWGRIDSIPMDTPALFYTPLGQPWLFHKVYNFGGIDIICPILGGSWWLPMAALLKA